MELIEMAYFLFVSYCDVPFFPYMLKSDDDDYDDDDDDDDDDDLINLLID
jgi:hypothetical protein